MSQIFYPKEALPRNGAALRIMSVNLLAERWSESHWCRERLPMPERAEAFGELICAALPDAVGLQETDQVWAKNLPPVLERIQEKTSAEYQWLFSEAEGKVNLSGILYRSDLYEAFDPEYRYAPYWRKEKYPYNIREYVWVRLREKTSGAEIWLVNTHWGIGNEERMADAKAQSAVVQNLLKQNTPVICTGDYNSTPDTEAYRFFRKHTSLFSAKEEARAEGSLLNETDGTGWVGRERTRTDNQIDHIFYSEGLRVLRYATMQGGNLLYLSDHSPQIADFEYTKKGGTGL